jgi:hypothetical protein
MLAASFELKSLICMVCIAFWRINLQFAWYLLHDKNETGFCCYFSFLNFPVASTTVAAYWQLNVFLRNICNVFSFAIIPQSRHSPEVSFGV